MLPNFFRTNNSLRGNKPFFPDFTLTDFNLRHPRRKKYFLKRKKERWRERHKEKSYDERRGRYKREREGDKDRLCVCVCVSERERECERERIHQEHEKQKLCKIGTLTTQSIDVFWQFLIGGSASMN